MKAILFILLMCWLMSLCSCSPVLLTEKVTYKVTKEGLYDVTIRKGFDVKRFLTECKPIIKP